MLDDEWHGINSAAMARSLPQLLAHFSFTLATCNPLNAYEYLLLKTTGWNEILLRLPSVAAGLLSLVVFPLFVRSAFNRRVTVIFAFLLAISPFLIFYSRYARPYSSVTLLGFTSIWALYKWATRRKTGYAALYVTSATLAIYFNFFAAVGVIAPSLVLLCLALRDEVKGARTKTVSTYPSIRAIALAGGSIVAVFSVFFISALASGSAADVFAKDRMDMSSYTGFLSLLSGTANPLCVIVCVALLACGVTRIYRDQPLFGGIIIGVVLAYFFALEITKPASIHEPIVIARYVILIFPLSMVAISVGSDAILNYLSRFSLAGRPHIWQPILNAAPAILLVALFGTGPLPRVYASPNNFTNHSVFQESYNRLSWAHSYNANLAEYPVLVRTEDIPDFYPQLANESKIKIIEYPMSFVDVFNPYYYYQHVHRQTVLIGYVPRTIVSQGSIVIWVDQALGLVQESNKLHFRNMVDLEDLDAVRSSGAKYIILHPNLLPEPWAELSGYSHQGQPFGAAALTESLIKAFGSPIVSDKNITVFELGKRQD